MVDVAAMGISNDGDRVNVMIEQVLPGEVRNTMALLLPVVMVSFLVSFTGDFMVVDDFKLCILRRRNPARVLSCLILVLILKLLHYLHFSAQFMTRLMVIFLIRFVVSRARPGPRVWGVVAAGSAPLKSKAGYVLFPFDGVLLLMRLRPSVDFELLKL